MALLYEKSATWRRIVNFTKRSPLYMAAFAGLCIGGPWLLGSSIKDATNPQEEGDLERRLRAKSGVHHEVRSGCGRAAGGRHPSSLQLQALV